MKRKIENPEIEECLSVNMMDDMEGVRARDKVYVPIYRVTGRASTIFRDFDRKIKGFSLITNDGIHDFLRGTFDYIMDRSTQEIIDGTRSYYYH